MRSIHQFISLLSSLLGFLILLSSCQPIQYASQTSLLHQNSLVSSSTLNAVNKYGIVKKEYKSFPNISNARVTFWINYFSEGSGRASMKNYLERSGRYKKLMVAILDKHNLPHDLFYVAMAESGFQARVESNKDAVGYWQFIEGTGRGYGLEINKYIDERQDFELATEAAARYLKKLYSDFENWELALAGYNYGEYGVKKARLANPTYNFWHLASHPDKPLPKETRNFVPKILAMREIGNRPWQYGFNDLNYQRPLNYYLIEIDKTVSFLTLSKQLKVSVQELQSLNPKYKKNTVYLDKNGTAVIRIPGRVILSGY